LASGRPGPPRREDGVTVRLRDADRGPGPAAAGHPAAGGPAGAPPARVRLFTAPGTARLTSLLEDADGPPLPLVDGAAEAVVPAAGTVTLALAGFGEGPGTAGPETAGPAENKPAENKLAQDGPAENGPARPGHAPPAAARAAGGPPGGPGGPPDPPQRVFSRYWLHGKGPAPAGNLPVAVHLSPGRVALAPAPEPVPADSAPGVVPTDSAPLRLTVACGPAPAR